MTLRVEGTRIEGNRNNIGDGFSTHPSTFFLGRRISFVNSTVE